MESCSKEALNESLEQYEQQLRMVEQALASNSCESQAADLLELKNKIEEVIELTKMALQQLDERASAEQTQVHNDTREDIDEEFAKFQAEMAGLGASSAPANLPNPTADLSKYLEEMVVVLENSKVQAPFSQGWGQMSHHNAIVHAVETSDITDVKDIKVIVLFTHPTVEAMKPCPYFLEDRCKFGPDRCRFSHGHAVGLSELREYSEPDFENIKPGSKCLVRSSPGDLWQLATMDCIGQEPDHVVVQIVHTGKTASIKVEDMFPLNIDEAEEGSGSGGLSDAFKGDVNPVPLISGFAEKDEAPVVVWASDQATGHPLGAWEKHTKGIGSKLMEKMGYVWGQGLGIRGDGRTEPVEAVVLPAGKSLDRCMELKELGMAQDSAKVQKKMLLKMKKAEEKIQKRYHEPSKPETVFDFLNGRIFSKKNPQDVKDCAKALKSASTKGLGIEALQVSGAIKKAEREIVRLGQSSARNKDKDRVVHAQAERKIEEQREIIRQLQYKERLILAEQQNRRRCEKLKIF